jgi:hypothetical protein
VVSSSEDLINLQTHKHSKTCRKKDHPVYRFGFPLPPLRKTVVLEPLETEVEKYKGLYKEMHKKINSLHEFQNIASFAAWSSNALMPFCDLLLYDTIYIAQAYGSNTNCKS